MRRFLILLLTLVSVLIGTAQNVKSENVFHTYIYNDEYKVYMDVNLYDANIMVLVRMCSGWFRDSSGRCATRVSGLLPTPRLLARTRQNWILSTITMLATGEFSMSLAASEPTAPVRSFFFITPNLQRQVR